MENNTGAGDLGKRGRVAYWVALTVFLLIAASTVLMASFAPMTADDPPVSQVELIETSRKSDGTTTTIERQETTTGAAGGGVLGWKLGRAGIFALQLTVGLLIAYLVAGLAHRVVCGHYALKMLGVELTEQATPIALAADAASATANERRVLAEDTIAERANLPDGIRPSSEPVDEDLLTDDVGHDVVFGLSDLGSSLATVLRQLLTPPPRLRVGSTEEMARILRNRGVLPPNWPQQLSASCASAAVPVTGVPGRASTTTPWHMAPDCSRIFDHYVGQPLQRSNST